MKISQVILELQKIQDQSGDKEIVQFDIQLKHKFLNFDYMNYNQVAISSSYKRKQPEHYSTNTKQFYF